MVWAVVLTTTFFMVNARLETWLADGDGVAEGLGPELPLWGVNLLLTVVGIGVGLLFWLQPTRAESRSGARS